MKTFAIYFVLLLLVAAHTLADTSSGFTVSTIVLDKSQTMQSGDYRTFTFQACVVDTASGMPLYAQDLFISDAQPRSTHAKTDGAGCFVWRETHRVVGGQKVYYAYTRYISVKGSKDIRVIPLALDPDTLSLLDLRNSGIEYSNKINIKEINLPTENGVMD